MSRCLVAAFAVVLAAPPAPAAPVPPDAAKGTPFPFPAKAPLVVCLNGYDTARAKLGKMLAAALPKDAAPLGKLLDATLDKLLDGRKLTAVRKDARAFLVLTDLASAVDDEPAVAVLVPVTKYNDFLSSFLTRDELRTLDRGGDGIDTVRTAAFGAERPAHLVDLKDYAAVTLDKETAGSFAARYAPASSDQMGREPAETFLKADLAVYVNMEAINEQHADEIRAFKGLAEFAIQQAQQQGALQAMNRKQVAGVKAMLAALVQGVEDCRAVVLGVEFRPEGLVARLQVRFADGSPSAKLIASERADPFHPVGRLPAGLGTYAGVRFGPSILGVIRDLGTEFATTADDARGAELIERHLKDLADAGPGGEFAAALPPRASITVTEYKEPNRAARALAKAFRAVGPGGRVNGVVVKAAPRVGDEAEAHRGFTFSSVNLTHDFEASVAGLPEVAKPAALDAFRRTVPEKVAHWIGTDGKVVVRVTAKDFHTAKGLLDSYLDDKGAVGASPGYRRVREQLPAEANFLFVAEVESAAAAFAAALRSAGDALPGFPRLGPPRKPRGGPPAYVGLAVTLKDDTATVTVFVPSASVEAARGVLDALFRKFD